MGAFAGAAVSGLGLLLANNQNEERQREIQNIVDAQIRREELDTTQPNRMREEQIRRVRANQARLFNPFRGS